MTNVSDHWRRSEKPSFSLTCNLLSQYIKEKGTGIPTFASDPVAKGKPEEIMNLMTGVHDSGDDHGWVKENLASRNATNSMELFPKRVDFVRSAPPGAAKEAVKAQLTMFYGGKVLVFDNFPAEKAMDLMQLASKSSSPGCAPAISPAAFASRLQPNFSDLPLARKASLHRFLQKRKDRIGAKAPYGKSSSGGLKGAVAVKQEEVSQP